MQRGDRAVVVSRLRLLLMAGVLCSCGAPGFANAAACVDQRGAGLSKPGSAPSPRFYGTTSFWNTPVAHDARIDPHSVSIVAAAILPHTSRAAFANGDEWGIGLAHASRHDKVYNIACLRWYCDKPVTFRIPKGAVPSAGSDHHLTVIYGDQELDMWDAAYDAKNDKWSAGSRFIGRVYGWGANAAPGQKAGGAVAAGFSEMGGVVRPEEMAQGHIDHAISMMIPRPRKGHVDPATAGDGATDDEDALPEGAHIALDPSFDVAAQPWPKWEKTLARALQTYGAFVADAGGSIAFYGQTDANAGNLCWAATGTPKGGSLANLPWNRMRVLDSHDTPQPRTP